MTVSTTTNRISYPCNGSTTEFDYDFKILDEAHLVVLLVTVATGAETTLELTTHYTVAGAGVDTGGSITTVATYSSAYKIVIIRDVPALQGLDLVDNDPLPAESLEAALDELAMLIQQLETDVNRAVLLADGFTGSVDLTLPVPTANKGIRWNSDGTGLENTADDIDDLAADSAASAAAAASSAAAAASSAGSSAADAVATAADRVQTGLDATSTAADVLSTAEDAIATAADRVQTGLDAASTAADALSTAADAVSTAADRVQTGLDATAAASAKTAAESARDATLAAFDSFDDRYLGAKASDPALDNDGNALVAGALYFNTTASAMMLYTGAAWVAAYVSGDGFQPSDAELTAIAGLASAANKIPMFSGSGTATMLDFKDEDDFSSNSATAVPSQQSVKAYADTKTTVFSSSAENVAGSIENKAVDPLGIREALNASGSAPIYACRAWVNFNGTGTVAIRASGNVSSITDNGTGDYTVNFTTAMSDANYAALGLFNGGSGGNVMAPYTTTAPTPTEYRIGTRRTDTFVAADTEYVNIGFFR